MIHSVYPALPVVQRQSETGRHRRRRREKKGCSFKPRQTGHGGAVIERNTSCPAAVREKSGKRHVPEPRLFRDQGIHEGVRSFLVARQALRQGTDGGKGRKCGGKGNIHPMGFGQLLLCFLPRETGNFCPCIRRNMGKTLFSLVFFQPGRQNPVDAGADALTQRREQKIARMDMIRAATGREQGRAVQAAFAEIGMGVKVPALPAVHGGSVPRGKSFTVFQVQIAGKMRTALHKIRGIHPEMFAWFFSERTFAVEEKIQINIKKNGHGATRTASARRRRPFCPFPAGQDRRGRRLWSVRDSPPQARHRERRP